MFPYSTGQTYQVTGHSNKEDYAQEHEYKEKGIIKSTLEPACHTPEVLVLFILYFDKVQRCDVGGCSKKSIHRSWKLQFYCLSVTFLLIPID